MLFEIKVEPLIHTVVTALTTLVTVESIREVEMDSEALGEISVGEALDAVSEGLPGVFPENPLVEVLKMIVLKVE